MNAKIVLTISIISAMSLGSCQGQQKPGGSSKGKNPVKLTNDIDSLSFAIGTDIGRNFMMNELGNINVDILAKGMQATFDKDSSIMSQQQCQAVIEAYMQGLQKKKQEAENLKFNENKSKGTAFLAENGKKSGVVTLPSGLQYSIMKEGKGDKPKATDIVKTHYHGTLISGKVFDSSVERGEPVSFPLNGVIKGWTEALQLMPVGSKWKLFIPYNLAYGDQGSPPTIGPGETLIFEVELLSIGE
jgi:FKBP-type peptidyl-prolyl cis-trans isomerase FklB